MRADVTSSKDNNSMLVRGTSILADKNMGFKADFGDELEITSKNNILFRRLGSEYIRAYEPTVITYNDKIKHVTLSNNSQYYLQNGFAVISNQEAMDISMESCEDNCILPLEGKAAFSGHFTIMKGSEPIIISRNGKVRIATDDFESISLSCTESVTAYSGTFEIDCAVPRFRFTTPHPYTITGVEPKTEIVPGMLTSGSLRMYEHNSPQYISILQDFNRYISRGFR